MVTIKAGGESVKYAKDFTPIEMMIIAASREIVNNQTLMVGTQWPVVVTMFAKRNHAPDIKVVFEGGIICDAFPSRIPFLTADPCLVAASVLCGDSLDTLGMVLHAGRVDLALLTAAHVDRYGNINTTCFGDYSRPNYRLGGSGGACDFACLAHKLIILLEHDKKRFPERVDYITSPGYLNGSGSRQKAGLRSGTGPWAVYSTLGRFKFDHGEMSLDAYYPGVTIKQIKEHMNWDLQVSENVKEEKPPTEEELRILREETDPLKMYLENARANIDFFKLNSDELRYYSPE